MPEIEYSRLIWNSSRESFADTVEGYINDGFSPHGQMYQDKAGYYFWLLVKYKK